VLTFRRVDVLVDLMLLFWLEVLSVTGEVDLAPDLLRAAASVVSLCFELYQRPY